MTSRGDYPVSSNSLGSELKGNFSREAQLWMLRRSEAFQRATSGKGQPATFGGGKRDAG